MASYLYLNSHIKDIYRMLREFNKFQPIIIYYKLSEKELINIDKQNINTSNILNTKIFKQVNINELDFIYGDEIDELREKNGQPEYKNYGINFKGFDCSLLSFVGSMPYSSNLFYICQEYNIFIPRSFHNEFIDPKDSSIYKNMILDECQICKKFIPPNSDSDSDNDNESDDYSKSDRNYHSFCDRKIRFIQHRYKTKLYNPYTEHGRRFIWKIGGYKDFKSSKV